jgi:hypothetical protein
MPPVGQMVWQPFGPQIVLHCDEQLPVVHWPVPQFPFGQFAVG